MTGSSSSPPWRAPPALPSTAPRLFRDLQRSNVELTLAYDTAIESWHAPGATGADPGPHPAGGALDGPACQSELRVDGFNDLGRGALLHDIGKLVIPRSSSTSPAALTTVSGRSRGAARAWATTALADQEPERRPSTSPCAITSAGTARGYPDGFAATASLWRRALRRGGRARRPLIRAPLPSRLDPARRPHVPAAAERHPFRSRTW